MDRSDQSICDAAEPYIVGVAWIADKPCPTCKRSNQDAQIVPGVAIMAGCAVIELEMCVRA